MISLPVYLHSDKTQEQSNKSSVMKNNDNKLNKEKQMSRSGCSRGERRTRWGRRERKIQRAERKRRMTRAKWERRGEKENNWFKPILINKCL